MLLLKAYWEFKCRFNSCISLLASKEAIIGGNNMNTNPNRHKAIEKLVKFSEADRLELLGYLLAKYPEITDTIIEFNPS
jgi:hypothetical protein